MNLIDSFFTGSYFKAGLFVIAVLLLSLWLMKIWREVRAKMQQERKNKQELARIQLLREQYKNDITVFLNSYRNDISTKLDTSQADRGLFIFWSGAEGIFEKFQNDTSEINKLPSQDERVAIRSFYTEARSFLDGILYNNYLLKKYQYLHCKIKTTTATSREVIEKEDLTEEMSTLGTQLQQQHRELLNSLESAKAYF